MTWVSLNLLTKAVAPPDGDPLDRIWSLDNWLACVPRALRVDVHVDSADRQLFDLDYRPKHDICERVTVERRRAPRLIEVRHLRPPQGVSSLAGRWWTEDENGASTVYASRAASIREAEWDWREARRMFVQLRENLLVLIGAQPCRDPA